MTDEERDETLRFIELLGTRLDRLVALAFDYLHPDKTFVDEPFLGAYCRALQDVEEGNERRLLVTMPPRHLKSFCAAVVLPAFALGRNPALKIAVVSYNRELSAEHADLFRRLINAPWFRHVFPDFELAARGDRNDHFRTTRGGGRRSVSIGGTFTGIGMDVLILDDLIKAGEVNSSVSRETVERFYTETALTRFDDPRTGRIISVQQRLHIEDIVARLIETGYYRHLNLPAIADRDVELPLYRDGVWRWREGDLLSPGRFPHEELARQRAEMGEAAFAAQFLLDPQLAGGQIVDWNRIHVEEEPFYRDEVQFVVQSIDTALRLGDDCDYSAITTWGFNGEKWRLLNAFHDRLEYPDLKSECINHAQRWGADRVLIEDATIGYSLWRELRRAGRDAVCIRPEGSKAERLGVAVEHLYSGQVELCSGVRGFDDLRRELVGFPSARHDDLVDTLSQFVLWARHRWMPATIAIANGRRPPARPRRGG